MLLEQKNGGFKTQAIVPQEVARGGSGVSVSWHFRWLIFRIIFDVTCSECECVLVTGAESSPTFDRRGGAITALIMSR